MLVILQQAFCLGWVPFVGGRYLCVVMKKITPLHLGTTAHTIILPLWAPSRTDFEHYICQNICRNQTLSALASGCNMSLSKFKAHFKQLYGIPPHRWLVRERLSWARSLLLTTDAQIKTIAYECGFSSPSHFIRLFHSHFGVTPATYRAQFGEAITIVELENRWLNY